MVFSLHITIVVQAPHLSFCVRPTGMLANMWAPPAEPSDDFNLPEYAYHTCSTKLDDWVLVPHPVHDMNRDVHKILFPFDVIKAVACGSKYRCPFFYLSRTYSCWGTQVCQAWPEGPQGAEHGADDDSIQLVGNVLGRWPLARQPLRSLFQRVREFFACTTIRHPWSARIALRQLRPICWRVSSK